MVKKTGRLEGSNSRTNQLEITLDFITIMCLTKISSHKTTSKARFPRKCLWKAKYKILQWAIINFSAWSAPIWLISILALPALCVLNLCAVNALLIDSKIMMILNKLICHVSAIFRSPNLLKRFRQKMLTRATWKSSKI